jgi:hypothetical protein
MITLTTIVFSISGFFSICGIFAEKDVTSRKYLTICFGICAAVVLAVNLFGGVL